MKTTTLSLTILFITHYPLGAEGPDVNALIAEFKGETTAIERSPEQLVSAYTAVIQSLLTALGSEEIGERNSPQQTLQAICWHASRPGAEAERVGVCKAIGSSLGPKTPEFARHWLLKQIEHIGREESVDTLASLLDEEDASIRERARRAIQNNSSPKAGVKIREQLEKSTDPVWQLSLLNSLVYRKEISSESVFLKYAKDDNESLRSSAIQGLALMGSTQGAEVIAAAMSQGSDRAQAIASDAYLRLADKLTEMDKKAEALAIYKKLLDTAGHRKCAAVIGVGRAGGTDELPLLFTSLQDADPKVVGAGKAALALLPGKEVSSAIVERLKTADADLKIALLEALAESADEAILPVFLESLKDADQGVRIAALSGMGRLASASAVPALVESIARSKEKELEAARNALAIIPGDAVIDQLTRAIDSSDSESRVKLIQTLATRPSDKVETYLKKTAMDKDVGVRIASLLILKKLTTVEDLPFLLGRLAVAETDDESEAVQAGVFAVFGRAEDKQKVVDDIMAQYKTSAKPAQVAILKLIGLTGITESLGALRTAWKSEDKDIKEAALRGMTEWPNLGASEDLLKIVKEGDDLIHKVLAFRGFNRMVGAAAAETPESAIDMLKAALEVAPRNEEKVLAIGTIGNIGHPKTLKVLLPHVSNEEIQSESAAAIFKVVETLGLASTAESLATLETLKTTVKSDKDKARADSLIQKIQIHENHIHTWLYAGPFSQNGKQEKDLYDIAFLPEAKPNEASWKRVETLPETNDSWKLDLHKFGRGDHRVGYLRTWVRVENPAKASLEVGSDDGVKAWLNGKEVLVFKGNRAIAAGASKVNVDLAAGWNLLQLKITNATASWDASARFRAEDGSGLNGLLTFDDANCAETMLADMAVEKQADNLVDASIDVAFAAARVDEQKQIVDALAKLTQDEAVLERAEIVLADSSEVADFILEWEVAGPYTKPDKSGKLFTTAFPPEDPDSKDVNWKNVKAEGQIVLLERLIGGDNRVAYLRAWIRSKRKADALLEIGTDDGCKVWLNGKLIHKVERNRAVRIGEDKVNVTLEQGINPIMLSVYNSGGGWSAVVRVRARNGKHLPGLRYLSKAPQ